MTRRLQTTLAAFTPSSARRAAAVLVAGIVLAGLGTVGAAAEEASELRGDVPTGTDLRAELAANANERTALVGSLARLEGEVDATLEARDALGAEGRRLAAEIEAMRESARILSVSEFITSGPSGEIRYLLDAAEVSDLSWQQYLIRNHARSTDEVVSRLEELESEATTAVLEAIARAEELRSEIDQIVHRILVLDEADRTAASTLVLADAWDRAEIAIAEGDYGFAPRERWEALRFCESTHDYAAISPSGVYRGAYQFDFETWQTVGGTGDPAAAPVEEQDARARELFARRGAQPWPVCGHVLEE